MTMQPSYKKANKQWTDNISSRFIYNILHQPLRLHSHHDLCVLQGPTHSDQDPGKSFITDGFAFHLRCFPSLRPNDLYSQSITLRTAFPTDFPRVELKLLRHYSSLKIEPAPFSNLFNLCISTSPSDLLRLINAWTAHPFFIFPTSEHIQAGSLLFLKLKISNKLIPAVPKATVHWLLVMCQTL